MGSAGATRAALEQAVRAAHLSRGAVPDGPEWLSTALGTAMGAAGGFGGAPTVLAELPVTTTLLLRVIQGAASAHGFDPAEDSVRFDCLTVFGSAGPMAADDGADTAFLTARQRADIFYGNAARFLELSEEQISAHHADKVR